MNFDLKDLRGFVAVAKVQNFGLAAEELHISQPALSRRIEKLEEALGVSLFHRTTRKVVLTAVGREFFQRAMDVLNTLEESLLGIQDVATHVSGEVSIACMPSAIRYFLPRILKKYHEHYPRIVIRVIDQGANDALATVLRGEADFGLNYIGSQEPQLEFEPVFKEPFLLACKKGHPLSERTEVKWSELSNYDYLSVTRASCNRMLVDMALSHLASRPKWFCEAQHVSTLVHMVEAGLGVAAVPQLAMPSESDGVLVSVPLVDPEISRVVGLIKRANQPLPPAAKHLYNYIIDECQLQGLSHE